MSQKRVIVATFGSPVLRTASLLHFFLALIFALIPKISNRPLQILPYYVASLPILRDFSAAASNGSYTVSSGDFR
jgi:hypothetical protein